MVAPVSPRPVMTGREVEVGETNALTEGAAGGVTSTTKVTIAEAGPVLPTASVICDAIVRCQISS